MKVIICEDNPQQQNLLYTKLRNYVMINIPSIEFVLVASNSYKVLLYITDESADCYFLNLNLGEGSNCL